MENKEDIAAFANVTKDTLEGGDAPSTPAPAAPAASTPVAETPVAAVAPSTPSTPATSTPSADVYYLLCLPHP